MQEKSPERAVRDYCDDSRDSEPPHQRVVLHLLLMQKA
jgi:hypothetical protein